MNLPHSDFSHRVMSCIIYLFHNHPPLLRLPNLWEARISDRTAIALSHRMLINFTIHVFSLHLSQDDIQTPLNPPRKYYYIHGPLDLYRVIFDPIGASCLMVVFNHLGPKVHEHESRGMSSQWNALKKQIGFGSNVSNKILITWVRLELFLPKC